jgi:hypothetical protein
VENSATDFKPNSLTFQQVKHHHSIQNRRLQELPPNEPVKSKPTEEPVSPLQKIERLVPELRLHFRQLWNDDPDQAATAYKRVLAAIKRPPKQVGRPLDKETARAVQLHDEGKPWHEIPYLVLDEKRAEQSHERLYLLRKAKAAVKRRDKQRAATRANIDSIS